MRVRTQFSVCLLLCCAGAFSTAAQVSADIHSPQHKAWDMLITAVLSKQTDERTTGIRAMGLLQDNPLGRDFAEHLLKDPTPAVRKAAATALGQMHAKGSIPKLEEALTDKNIPVVMAAAQSLRELKDENPAYELYYELLTGERKSSDGLIAEQLAMLKNPRELAKIGFSQGIGYIPFAGMGWDAYRTIHKKDPNPVRAVAARLLAHDPDPASARALMRATHDKNWIIRAAAVQAIAERGDPSLLPSVERRFADKNSKVRYSAAAAVIRLNAEQRSRAAKKDDASGSCISGPEMSSAQ